MAIYYWVGVTSGASGATQNCNITSNWTLWGPGSIPGGTLPPAAPTIPKYNDSVIFCRFSDGNNNTTYPKYGPFGTMMGISGPAGNTAAQFFVSVGISGDYPVGIGKDGTTPFTFGTSNLTLLKTSVEGTTFIDIIGLNDNAGVTKSNAWIKYKVTHSQGKTYSIQGNAIQLRRDTPTDINQFSTENDYGRFDLRKFTIEDSGPNPAISESNYKLAQTVFIVGPETSIQSNIILNGHATKFLIEKGFGFTTSDKSLRIHTPVSGSQSGSTGPTIEFMYESGLSGGSTGPEETTRTYIEKLATQTGSKTYGLVNVYHGTDFNYLEQSGSKIVFGQDPGLDGSVVQEGSFAASNSTMIIKNGSVNIGSNGSFYIHSVAANTPVEIIPEINPSSGISAFDLDLSPVSGWTGSYTS
jgi:hypothetical protein